MRAYPGQVNRTYLQATEKSPLKLDSLSRAFDFITSPIEGGTTSRDASTLFRNDQLLDALGKWFDDNIDITKDQKFFTTVLFENVLDVSMTWYTTEQEIARIKNGFSTSVDEDRNRKNQQSFEQLKQWWLH